MLQNDIRNNIQVMLVIPKLNGEMGLQGSRFAGQNRTPCAFLGGLVRAVAPYLRTLASAASATGTRSITSKCAAPNWKLNPALW